MLMGGRGERLVDEGKGWSIRNSSMSVCSEVKHGNFCTIN
jgi:hypothetical protein